MSASSETAGTVGPPPLASMYAPSASICAGSNWGFLRSACAPCTFSGIRPVETWK